jgi:hypothetical protein
MKTQGHTCFFLSVFLSVFFWVEFFFYFIFYVYSLLINYLSYLFTSQMFPPFCSHLLQSSSLHLPSPSPLERVLPTMRHQLYKMRPILSHWGQPRHPSATYVPGGLDQPLYALWLSFSLWELLGVQVSWHCSSSYGTDIPSSFFNPSPNSFRGIPDFCPMFTSFSL